jgi:hypothetical protein
VVHDPLPVDGKVSRDERESPIRSNILEATYSGEAAVPLH